jgi:putative PIN family toxin of toxin-antitoxin system
MRCVIDTNVLISAAAFPLSIPRQALRRVLRQGILLFSEATADELKAVLSRPKFDRYVSRKERALFLAQIQAVAEVVPIIQRVRECRDPKDDKLLEVALNGRADVIITGDVDLLVLHPWRGVTILTPADYLAR